MIVGGAIALGLVLRAYDGAVTRGAAVAGGDLGAAFVTLDVILVLGLGSVITYLIIPLPRGSAARSNRTAWCAALRLLAAAPIAYLVLVVESQVLKPLLT